MIDHKLLCLADRERECEDYFIALLFTLKRGIGYLYLIGLTIAPLPAGC